MTYLASITHIKFALVILLFFLSACDQQQITGPEAIRWDKQVCTRCAMSIGDNKFATQIRGGQQHQIYRFDDVGCAVIWLDQQTWKLQPSTEIWVADHLNGEWIDAKQAWYTPNRKSPMGYNLGAGLNKTMNSLSFDKAVKYIQLVENNEHIHRGQNEHTIKHQ